MKDNEPQQGPAIPPPLGGPTIPPPLNRPSGQKQTQGPAENGTADQSSSPAQSRTPEKPTAPPIAESRGANNAAEPTVEVHENITFAAYRYADQDEPLPLRIDPIVGEEVRLAWEPADRTSFYRVVYSDREWPFSPDADEELVVTSGASHVSRLPFETAVRYYQVWRYEGEDIYEARIQQPTLHAQGYFIVGVREPRIGPDGSQIIAHWKSLPGTSRVQINRVVRKDIRNGLRDARSQILGGYSNLSGFVDAEVESGQRYVYQFRSEVEVDGVTQLSDPVTHEVEVPFVLTPVTDLRFTLHDGAGDPTFDLEWTPPVAGEVRIYRSVAAPVAGLRKEAIPLRALSEDAKLKDEDWINRPVQIGADGTVIMNGVPWPKGWTRAYFTAVVVDGDQAFVGNTVHGVRVPPLTRAKVTERVGVKLVHFHWPAGVDVVQAFVSQNSDDTPQEGQKPYLEIDEKTYRDNGGLHVRGDGNLRYGGIIQLVAISFSEGRRVASIPVAVPVDPLLVIGYDITVRRNLRGQSSAQVSVFAYHEQVRQAIPFVLVHNPERLPLTAQDGTVLPVQPLDLETAQPAAQFAPPELPLPDSGQQVPTWTVEQSAWNTHVRSGYLRAFVAVPPEHLRSVALIDPPITKLTVSTEGRAKQFLKGLRRG